MSPSTDPYLQLAAIVTRLQWAISLTVALWLPSFSITGYNTSRSMPSKFSRRRVAKIPTPSSNRHNSWMLLFSPENDWEMGVFCLFNTRRSSAFLDFKRSSSSFDIGTPHCCRDKYSANMSVTHVRRRARCSLGSSIKMETEILMKINTLPFEYL